MSDNQHVMYDKVLENLSRIRFLPPVPKTVKNTPINYKEMPAKYNYGALEGDGVLMREFLLQCPLMKSSTGLWTKPKTNGKGMDHSIRVMLSQSDPKQLAYIRAISGIHKVAAMYFKQVSAQCGKPDFDANNAAATGFKLPIKIPRDANGAVIQGEDIEQYLKVVDGFEGKTLFTGPNLKPIPWAVLANSEITFAPLLHITGIYISGNASLQIKIKSAIVTRIVPGNTKSTQDDFAKMLLQENPDLESEFESQVASAMMERKDAILDNLSPKSSKAEAPKQVLNDPFAFNVPDLPPITTGVQSISSDPTSNLADMMKGFMSPT